MSTEHQVDELLGFLLHPTPQLAQLSLVNLLPFTVQTSPYRNLFTRQGPGRGPDGKGYVTVLAGLSRASKDPSTAQAALTALVNLTDSVTVCAQLASLEGFVSWLLQQILDTSSPLSDVACMLLSNLTKMDSVCKACLHIQASAAQLSTSTAKNPAVRSLDQLVSTFARDPSSNKNKANYDYLAHVFANISAVNIADGRQSLLGMPESLAESSTAVVPLADLVVFTEHKSAIRRAGVASTLKNCAFVQEAHPLLLSSGKVNFLPYILLPLCGPEEFDLEEQEKFPDELQLLPPDKQREGDSKIRLMLVETLILLCATRQGREELRNKGVYEIVKVTHKVEPDDEVRVAIERLVNLLMRGEPEEEKIQEINGNGASQAQQDEDEDAMVQEV